MTTSPKVAVPVEPALVSYIDAVGGIGPDGKPAVFLSITVTGAVMLVCIPARNMSAVIDELTRVSDAARTGLHFAKPGDVKRPASGGV